MSILTNILSVLTADIRTTVISLIIALIVYKISKFYVKVFSLPPGPIPLPILGNVLHLLGTKEHWTHELEKIGEKYGPVFTFWAGTFPVVYISDIHIGQEAFRKNDFAGRPVNMFTRLVSKDGNYDVATSDYGHQWEALRRVAHSAVQKYSTTEKLVLVSSDCVDHTIKTILEKEGLNKPFDTQDYCFNTFLNILSNSAFGERWEWDSKEFKTIKKTQKMFFSDNTLRLTFWEMFPFLMKIQRKAFNEISMSFDESIQLMRKQFKSHQKDYNELIIRDFCDTIISAKNDALREGKESAPYLTDDNLILAVFDLFFGGTSTSTTVFRWILFLITYYPEIQKKLRQEIENEIGDRIPTHEDRNRCHYVMAVMSETLRLRNIAAAGANHKAVVDSKIGEYTIPEGTQIAVQQGYILHKEEYWPNAQEFRPERFLENGKYVTTRPKAYIPFGIGRRVCLGERLAIADIFLVFVRFLQKTVDYELVLHYSGDTLPDANKVTDLQPKEHKISLRKIN